MRTVLTLGTFDLFHVGHVELLRECRALAGDGLVIVAVNADEFVARFKGVATIYPLTERMAMVIHSKLADAVFPHWSREYTPTLLDIIRPDIIAVGDDWQGRDYLGQLGVTQDWLDGRGIRVVYVPRTTGVSSSALRVAR